ncbi:MAG: cysteine--tRNA ligase [Opitutaceae bacterium]
MAIRLFDSLSREVSELKPGQADGVFRFYNCGPTVYAPAHIGNFRTFVINDVIRRLLELEFGADKVKHVRNITDVDDKTIRRARDQGKNLEAVTKFWTDKFHADCEALNCLRPHLEPTATSHIAEQIEMIARLVEKGNAYATKDGSVYFKVASFPAYGRLSHLKERELQSGISLKSHATDSDEKEDGSDFALWKAHKSEDGEIAWDSPWGRGRPGWHIECSAMAKQHLGETIDLHTGAVDLLFPHHENEIAQSECCNGAEFSRHWYHNEHLLVDGKKMSKSLGNLYTLDDIRAKGFSPAALRYALLAGHPRKQLNFTLDSLHAAEKALKTLRAIPAVFSVRQNIAEIEEPSQEWGRFFEALKDDLNTPNALGELFKICHKISFPSAAKPTHGDIAYFEKAKFALGLSVERAATPREEAPAQITALAEKRWAAKQAKDFKTADALRGEIQAAGWQMHDRKDAYSLERLRR